VSTRIYFPSNIVAPCSPAYDAEWNISNNTQRKICLPAKQGAAFLNVGNWGWAASPLPQDSIAFQFISPGLKAQTITGTVKGQFRVAEYAAADDCCRAVVIKVVSNDGSTVRGILLSHFPASLVSEWSVRETYTNRAIPPLTTLTDVTCQAGDRLVIELGGRFFAASYRNAAYRIGDASATDLPEDETTTSDYNPWMEFSHDIQWDNSVQVGSMGAQVAYDLAPGVQVNAMGIQVAYSLIPDVGAVQINAMGLQVAYSEAPEIVTRRVFPLPSRSRRYQTQWGKRKFPLAIGDF